MEFSKRTLAKEHNRRVILEAARGVFSLYGYRTATVRDIIGATSRPRPRTSLMKQ